jgi:hypothetical protein
MKTAFQWRMMFCVEGGALSQLVVGSVGHGDCTRCGCHCALTGSANQKETWRHPLLRMIAIRDH